MKVKYFQLNTQLMTIHGIEDLTIIYKFENGKWYNKFPGETKWDDGYDPHENKWPHDKVKEITEAEAFFGLI